MDTQQLQSLVIEGEKGTFYIPNVHLDAETGHCQLEGESYLENTWEFYGKLLDWLKAFSRSRKPIQFDFKLSYFNTSSSKGILQLLMFLEEYKEDGGEVIVNWYYPSHDEDLKEEAEDFMVDTNLKINMYAI